MSHSGVAAEVAVDCGGVRLWWQRRGDDGGDVDDMKMMMKMGWCRGDGGDDDGEVGLMMEVRRYGGVSRWRRLLGWFREDDGVDVGGV
ncbi:hypothetical protein Tco_1063520 [Tanacetum coccineum]